MIAAFAIFRLVIDYFVDDFNLPNGIVALEVCRVVVGIPKAKLNSREKTEVHIGAALVGQGNLPDFERLSKRDKIARRAFNPIPLGSDDGIALSMTAFILIELQPRWHP